MPDSLQIRPAEPSDAEVAAVLLYSAYIHKKVTYPLPEAQGSGFSDRLEGYFRQAGNRFSYQYIQVAELGAQVVGLVLSFGGRDEPRLNAAVGPWLTQEAGDNEWYIDALAVLENWTRRGIGTRLLHTAEQQARQHHYPEIALNVAEENTEALNLYIHQGYVVTRRITLYQRPHARMVKILAKDEQENAGIENL